MFNFFKKDDKPQEPASPPEWIEQLEETQSRLFTFLEKLEERMKELTEAAILELQTLRMEDEQEFGIMLHGVNGQLNSVRNKASNTYEEKVEVLYDQIHSSIDFSDPYYRKLNKFRSKCSDRFHTKFEDVYHQCQSLLAQLNHTDYAELYQQILNEHDSIKDQFKCQQCGDMIPLTKIYFTISHLTCPSCQTKNTFHPSTLASRLEEIGRGLAEQRTQHLLDKYNREQERERELYFQAHEMKLDNSFNPEPEILAQIEQLEKLCKESKALAPQLYQQYQRAMFDEWKKLVPDLAEQTENFYQGLQNRKF